MCRPRDATQSHPPARRLYRFGRGRFSSRGCRRRSAGWRSDAAVVFFFELVFYGVRGGVTPLPESFDEVIALLVIRELLEGGALFVRNDVGYVFIKPFFETAADFLLEALLVFLPLLLRQRAFEGIGFLILRLGRCRTGLARTVGLGGLR